VLGPYPIESVIDALAEVSAIKRAAGVADLEAARNEPPRKTPAAHVVHEETGRPGAFAEQSAQPISVIVKIVLWVQHAGEADTGGKAAAAMSVLEAAVRDKLIGFQPDVAFDPLTIRASGNDLYYGGCLTRQLLLDSAYTAAR
jgi:hypothetical protein